MTSSGLNRFLAVRVLATHLKSKSESRTFIQRATDAPAVTALLAVTIMVVLTVLEIFSWMNLGGAWPKHTINPIFTNALTLVLGYYFGQTTSKAQ